MASTLVNGGTRSLALEMDNEGHRTYTVSYLVRCETADGPATILTTTGLPQFGDTYSFGSESDPWAFCLPGARIAIHDEKKGEPARFYTVEKTFSTKPLKKCAEGQWEDPLLQPQRVTGAFQRTAVEHTTDRYGSPITNSAWERIRGKEVEEDVFHSEIRIEQNVASLELPLLQRLNNTLNDAPLWGVPRRCVKCVVQSWEQKFHGLCSLYYSRTFVFSIRVRIDPSTGAIGSGWDRDIADEGTKALNGEWNTSTGNWNLLQIAGGDPSPYNPAHFCRIKDRQGENTKITLNGAGVPIDTQVRGAITNITGPLVSPIVVTTNTAHGLSSGDVVSISGFTGTNHAARGVFLIEVLSATTFSLLTIPSGTLDDEATVDTVGSGTYVSGGLWYNVGASGPGKIHVELLAESNFLLLGIPPDLDLTY